MQLGRLPLCQLSYSRGARLAAADSERITGVPDLADDVRTNGRDARQGDARTIGRAGVL
jgi:hypothetical protein